ncbi:MAG: hypothetical protein FWH57_00130 [Oscillospiraceae bacterium]|nr:hypothetical protein [Oscillospiraceae bacterium]
MKMRIATIALAIILMLATAMSCVNLGTSTPNDEPPDSIADEPPESIDDEIDIQDTVDNNEDPSPLPDKIDSDATIDKIPEYEIKQTLYQELRADDGVLLARNEVLQPVFAGEGASSRRMNEVFENDLKGYNLDDFDYLPEAYDSREGYVYSEAQAGRVGGSLDVWEESYRINKYISFVCYADWDALGAHGSYELSGRVFDVSTGGLLSIYDVFSISEDDITEVLYNEYINYHSALGDGLDEMALGYEDGQYNSYFELSVKEQCGDNAVFWLSSDGVHIYFHQYTFYYAIGSSELVIAYNRSDLLQKPFAMSKTGGA